MEVLERDSRRPHPSPTVDLVLLLVPPRDPVHEDFLWHGDPVVSISATALVVMPIPSVSAVVVLAKRGRSATRPLVESPPNDLDEDGLARALARSRADIEDHGSASKSPAGAERRLGPLWVLGAFAEIFLFLDMSVLGRKMCLVTCRPSPHLEDDKGLLAALAISLVRPTEELANAFDARCVLTRSGLCRSERNGRT